MLPSFNYADIVCGDKGNSTLTESIQILQNKALICPFMTQRPKPYGSIAGVGSHKKELSTVAYYYGKTLMVILTSSLVLDQIVIIPYIHSHIIHVKVTI